VPNAFTNASPDHADVDAAHGAVGQRARGRLHVEAVHAQREREVVPRARGDDAHGEAAVQAGRGDLVDGAVAADRHGDRTRRQRHHDLGRVARALRAVHGGREAGRLEGTHQAVQVREDATATSHGVDHQMQHDPRILPSGTRPRSGIVGPW
jgi:hypothetical protein